MLNNTGVLSLVNAGKLALGCCALLGCGSGSAPERAGQAAQPLSLPGITLQTQLVPRFVGAQNNGGGALNATATVAQGWETFTLEDRNGGALESGDSVNLRAGGGQYWQALNGGGSSLSATGSSALGWETFKIVKQSGSGVINNGDSIGLQTSSGSWVSAQNGGGAGMFAYGGALGSWERLKIAGLPAATTPVAPSNPAVSIANVSFRSSLQNRYVGAQNGGGSGVIATALSAQAWESFTLEDLNGGALESGDSVLVRAAGGQYLQALNGGGSSLNAASQNRLTWETFKLVRKAGNGTVASGDVVGLQTSSGAWVSAENGGGGSVFAYGGALGTWESFVIGVGAPAATPTPTGWHLVWSDEFDGSALDTNKWNYEVQPPAWANEELQNYTYRRPENARVENGHLVIEARRDNFGGEYSSARIKTQGKISFSYGRFEARMQLPVGKGPWPAFWMLPDDFSRGWPACGEIDVMEQVGFDPDTIHATTHSLTYNWKGTQERTATVNVPGATTGYHVYAVEWYTDRIDFFVDDRKYYSSPNDNTGDDAWPFHKNFYLILNLAVGGVWGGALGVDPNIWPQRLLVDYVRVYQR